jgi:hypothetical protein
MRRQLDGQAVDTSDGVMPMNDLLFYPQNPRVFSVLRTKYGNETPTQENIFELMSKQDYVKELKRQIKKDGLKEPVIVNKNTMEVIEGNSRLAAYRMLYDEDPMKWSEISCELLPESITNDQIEDLISSVHMVNTKKHWDPAEVSGWLWRLSNEENFTTDKLVKKFSGWSAEKINNYISTFQFMIDNNLTDHSQFSHWLLLKTNKHIKKIKKDFPQFDQVIIKKVQSGEIDKAVRIREELTVIASGPKKLVKKFVEGEIPLVKAHKFAIELGVHKNIYKKLDDFKEWIVNHQDSILKTKGTELVQVKHNLRLIKHNIDITIDKLK